MIEWKTKIAFLLFIPLIIFLVQSILRKGKKKAFIQFSSIETLKSLPKGLRAFFSFLPSFLKFLSLAFVILALARPQKANIKTKRNIQGIDIIVALDVSSSMLIEDMTPAKNRLNASKATIKEFIEGRTSDRIGLIVFSGESYTRVPLTLDYPLLLQNLSLVETSENIKMGTAIGIALANAVGRLKDSRSKSRIIIFLTDGENNSGMIDPETAIEIAKGYEIKIYSIGMGRDGQAKVPFFIKTPTGQVIKKYRPMHSKVNEKLLKKMANETKGKYYRASTLKGLKNIFSDINQLEKSKIEINKYTNYAELFPFYLKLALLFYFLSCFLGQTLLKTSP